MSRTVHCEDAITWLEKYPKDSDSSFVASLPDISEFPTLTLAQWKEWFVKTASLILSRTADQGVAIFYQSDIKYEGVWVDKAYLCMKAAEGLGHELLWHKVICRVPAGMITFGRPAYSHIVCFSRELKLDPSRSSPDVIAQMGEKTWERGMGSEACKMIARFISEQTRTKKLINPFCGEGSMLLAGEQAGLQAVGIERSPKRAHKALHL